MGDENSQHQGQEPGLSYLVEREKEDGEPSVVEVRTALEHHLVEHHHFNPGEDVVEAEEQAETDDVSHTQTDKQVDTDVVLRGEAEDEK